MATTEIKIPNQCASPSEVADWIAHLSVTVAPYAPRFREKEIDGAALRQLTDDHLKDILGITNPIHRLSFLHFIQSPKQSEE